VNVFDGIIGGFRKRSGEKSFLDRLDDVRGRIFRAALALIVGTAVGFWVAMNYDVLGILTSPVQPFLGGQRLKYLNPVDPFYVTFQLALFFGILVTLPYLLRQFWLLIEPMLLAEEKRLVLTSIFGGVVLFFVGMLFCYYLTLPLILRFTMGFQSGSLEQSIVIGDYLKMVLRLLATFGIAFELPILVLLGTVLGAVTPEFLTEKRRYAIAIIMIVSAVVTPTDIGSMLLLTIPAVILYEIGILISRLIVTKRASSLAAPEFR
jgi:sec-independent protein translocase protein TatC